MRPNNMPRPFAPEHNGYYYSGCTPDHQQNKAIVKRLRDWANLAELGGYSTLPRDLRRAADVLSSLPVQDSDQDCSCQT
jgi:hypothetical protein